LLELFIRHHERHFVIGIVPLHVSEALCCDIMRIVPAKRARAAGISPAAHALRSGCDAQRRVVERCDAPRRAALPTVVSIILRVSSTKLTWLVARQPSRQRCCRSCRLFRPRRKSRDCWKGMQQDL
jgi:hypothetical protein